MAEKEIKPVVIKGILTGAFYGTTRFDKKSEKLHISIKFDDGQREKLVRICEEAGIFNKVDSGFIPKWYKDIKSEYINFKSNYDVQTQYLASDGGLVQSSVQDMLADLGSLNGSHCAASLTLKEGAVYIKALAIDDLKVADFGEMFGDENPFD